MVLKFQNEKKRNYSNYFIYKGRLWYSQESYNKTDFLLNNINLQTKNVIVINDKNSLKYWLFTKRDIISIFKLALLHRDDFIPEPMIPKNPYNNLEFTKEQ